MFARWGGVNNKLGIWLPPVNPELYCAVWDFEPLRHRKFPAAPNSSRPCNHEVAPYASKQHLYSRIC